MTAKERALTKRLADLEERVRHLEAEPREIHHHYPAPQPIYVRPAYPYPYQPYTPWWGTLTCGTPYNGTIESNVDPASLDAPLAQINANTQAI